MTKSELIKKMADVNAVTLPEAEAVVDSFIATLSEALLTNGRIELRGFGSFAVREYNGYLGRNPRSGEAVNVAPKKMPFFRPGSEIKKSINGGV